ncbi:hypothetical protein ACF09L_20940 [Streptomyces sp. NPDC014779]|uniref:hypothetical protein n=1 Tax=Streptomyces sp. NPDC014779 TaxID=3364911 RepID=UPI0036F6B047
MAAGSARRWTVGTTGGVRGGAAAAGRGNGAASGTLGTSGREVASGRATAARWTTGAVARGTSVRVTRGSGAAGSGAGAFCTGAGGAGAGAGAGLGAGAGAGPGAGVTGAPIADRRATGFVVFQSAPGARRDLRTAGPRRTPPLS